MAEIIKQKKDYTNKDFIKYACDNWSKSKERAEMQTGIAYYEGRHDILNRHTRGYDRTPSSVYDVERNVGNYSSTCGDVCAGTDNLPDNRLVDNQYGNMVDQKTNYLLGKPPVYSAKNEKYSSAAKDVLNANYNRVLRNIGTDVLNCAVGWLFVGINAENKLDFKRMNPLEIIPFWSDSEETELECLIRDYTVEIIDLTDSGGANKKDERRIEVYLPDRVYYYIYDTGGLVNIEDGSYFEKVDSNGNVIAELDWGKIPFICFRYNDSKIPLIRKVKLLQDALNEITSIFMNNMQEDARSTIFVLNNYGGQSGAEFRKWLMQTGVINVNTSGDAKGGVETLSVEVNAANYDLLISVLRRGIVVNGRGYDAKDANSGGDPNEMNLKSMYNDIDLDANMMETEFQASFEDLFYFVDNYLIFSGKGDFTNESISVVFNRDTIVDEGSIVDILVQSEGILSLQTRVEQHPFVTNAEDEMGRIEAEKEKQREEDDMYLSAMSLKDPADGGAEEIED